MDRRAFVGAAGLAAAGVALGTVAGCGADSGQDVRELPRPDAKPGTDSWEGVRAHFDLDPDLVHMAGLFLASHPTPIRDAIAEYRDAQNANPAEFVEENMGSLLSEVRSAAARYMGVRGDQIALTDSTTMGTALAITGLSIREDQEMLTARYDYYSTHESMRYLAARTGASMRTIALYDNVARTTEDEIIENLLSEIRAETRLVSATWVHSSTGLKMPVRQIADGIRGINAGRNDGDRVVFFVDGVHGFGVEDTQVGDLGCDVFSSGTHKWMFGPRGTGVLWADPAVHGMISPTIPTFTDGAGWGGRMSPGGFKPFEHQWAAVEAFRFHEEVGKTRVRERIHYLARQIKEGLAEMQHVTLYTPMDEELSSGIVCFDVDGMSEGSVVRRLRDRGIVASTTPYDVSHARLTPGLYNTPDEIEHVLRAIADLG